MAKHIGAKMIYRVPDEIKVQVERMQPPIPKFNYKGGIQLQLSTDQLMALQDDAFQSGYEQAIKEMKQFFGVQ